MKTLVALTSLFILIIFSSDGESQIFRRRSVGFSGGCSTSYCPPPYVASVYVAPYVAPVVVTRPQTTPYVAPVYDDLDSAFLRIADHQQRHQFFLEKLQALGLNRNFANNIYGQYGASNQVQNYGQLGTSGNTLYGTSVQQLYNYSGFSPEFIGSLYLQAAQAVNGAKEIHGQAIQGHQDLVAQAVKVSEINARSDAAMRFLTYLEVPKFTGSSTVNTVSNIPTVNGSVQPNSQQMDKASVRLMLCGKCHGPNRKEAGLDITEFNSFSTVQKGLIMGRLTTTDSSKRMPRNPDGSAGTLRVEALEYFK